MAISKSKRKIQERKENGNAAYEKALEKTNANRAKYLKEGLIKPKKSEAKAPKKVEVKKAPKAAAPKKAAKQSKSKK